MKKVRLLALVLAVSLLACACGKKEEAPAAETTESTAVEDAVVEIVVKDYGTITVALDGEAAPITVPTF